MVGTGIVPGTTITGGSGLTWTVNNSQSVSSEAMTSGFSYETEMHNVVGRMGRYNGSADPIANFDDNFLATSEGTEPLDAVLATLNNAGLNTWKSGIDISTAIFSSGRAMVVPNNSCYGTLNSSSISSCILFDSAGDVAIHSAPSAAGTACLASGNYTCELTVGSNTAQGVTIGTPTGSFAGAGTLNAATGVLVNNVRVDVPLYVNTGAAAGAHHMVFGTQVLTSGSATVSLSGSAVFVSGTSYVCTGTDQTSVSAVKITNTSGSSFTISGNSADTIGYVCVGQ